MELRYNEPLYNKVLGKTIYFAPGVAKYMEQNLVIANKFCQSLAPTLYPGSTVVTDWHFLGPFKKHTDVMVSFADSARKNIMTK